MFWWIWAELVPNETYEHHCSLHWHADGLVAHADGCRPHRAGEGGGEHDRLPIGPDVGHDQVDLGLEAHVKHAVRLVHDQVGHTVQVGDLAG